LLIDHCSLDVAPHCQRITQRSIWIFKSEIKVRKLLSGRTAQIPVTMDTPDWYYRWVWHRPGHTQMRHTILGYCGIELKRISELAPVHGAGVAKRLRWLRQARELRQRCVQG